MSTVYLSLGSNLGDKRAYLENAVEKLRRTPDISVERISEYYETEPVGYTEQDTFLNICVKLATPLPPLVILDICLNIEQELGRKRLLRWGPRTIDIDLLLYDDLRMNDERLTLPHPRMFERAFVLVPLTEILEKNDPYYERVINALNNLSLQGIQKKVKKESEHGWTG